MPKKSKLYGSISRGEALTPMPPADKPQFFGTPKGDEIIAEVRTWIEKLEKPQFKKSPYSPIEIYGTNRRRVEQ